MRLGRLVVGLAMLLVAGSAQAASYLTIDGTVVDPIQLVFGPRPSLASRCKPIRQIRYSRAERIRGLFFLSALISLLPVYPVSSRPGLSC